MNPKVPLQELSINGSPIRYQRSGAGEVLVFVHGYLGGAAIWSDQLEEFGKTFDVVIPELPGYGSSFDLPSHSTIKAFADQILALLVEIGIKKFHLVGHSMGGMIAQQMTLTAPNLINKLVCYGTGPQGVLPDRFETIAASKFRMEKIGVPETAYRIATSWFVDHKDAAGLPACLEMSKSVTLETCLAGLTAMETWDVLHFIKTITQKTLVIWGDQDRSYGWSQPEALWKEINNSNLCVLPGCGHNAHLEQPKIFNCIVKDFLSKS